MSSYWKSVERSTAIVRVLRDGCSGHQRPCHGCADYCDIHEGNAESRGAHDLYDAYGEYECQGEMWWHESCVWKVSALCYPFDGPVVELAGLGDSFGEAEQDLERMMLDYEARTAAVAIACSRCNGYEDQ